jgi:hypothetical protein
MGRLLDDAKSLRRKLEAEVWKVIPKDYRATNPRRAMMLRNGVTTIVPLSEWTEVELLKYLGRKS